MGKQSSFYRACYPRKIGTQQEYSDGHRETPSDVIYLTACCKRMIGEHEMIVTREDLQTLRDLRDVALAEYKGCIIEVIRCKPKIYYWRKGKRCSATTFENAAEAARDFLGK